MHLFNMGFSSHVDIRHYLLFPTPFCNQSMPATHLKIGGQFFSFAGPAAWNSLPASVQDIQDHQVFKRNLKTELV